MSEQEVAATATETDEVQETEQETTSTEGDAELGAAGEKALEAWKVRAREAEKELKAARAAAAKAEQEAALKDKPAEEQEIERAKAEARAEATSAANKRILRSELKAIATGKLADPTDAALYIDLDAFTVSDDGDVDSDALSDAIAELLVRKPHLSAQKPNRFDGDADQGSKGKDETLSQLTRADMERMSPAEVNEARRLGRFNKVLGVTT